MSAHEMPVSVDGAIVAGREARVSVLDTTFTQGLGAFDTLLVEHGVARLVERHVARLRDTCTFLGLRSAAIGGIEGWLAEYVAVLPKEPLAVRTTVTRGPEASRGAIVLAARRFEAAPTEGVRLTIERRFALAGDELDRHKTTSRARLTLAREAARKVGAFDALVCHVDGDVADATIANVWALVDGELRTPPIERGALPGIVRAVLLDELACLGHPVRERPLDVADLARAEEIFLTSSVHRVVGVRAIEGLVDGRPGLRGAVARHALELVLAAEAREA